MTFQGFQSYYTMFFSNMGELSYPNVFDHFLVIPFFILMTVGRVFLERFAFSPLGRFLCRMNAPTFHIEKPQEFEKKIIKFQEQTFKCLYHCFVALWALWAFSDFRWWSSDIRYTMQTDVRLLKFSSMHKLYYIFQTAFHLHSLLYHYIERRNHVRDDDLQMQIHHMATIFLLVGSFHVGHLRIGTLVLYVHDMSDVFVAITKIFNYTKFRDGILVVLLSNLVLSWAYYRLYRFPKDVILIIMEQIGFANKSTFDYSLMFGLIVLFILHVIWFYQIIQIPMAIVYGNEEYDTTEHWKEATKMDKKERERRIVTPQSQHQELHSHKQQ
uniref:TLC domain-containing protein n=1 Tax=Percolomonas cosmopolitus TaxID=63605 RepID=A0A7S1PJT5_9EUKA